MIQIEFDSNTQVYFSPSQDYSRVEQAAINFAPGSGPRLGTLITTYGVPCEISMNPFMSFLAVNYQYATAHITLAQGQTIIHLMPSLKIDSMSFQSQENSCVARTSGEWSWQGFKELSYYPRP